MNKKVILSTLVGGVVGYFLGWLIWGLILKSFLMANMNQFPGLMRPDDPPQAISMVCYFVGSLAYAWMVAYVFNNFAHATTFGAGAKIGMTLMIAIAIAQHAFQMGGMDLYHPPAAAAEVVANAVLGALVGGTVAMVQGKVGGAAA